MKDGQKTTEYKLTQLAMLISVLLPVLATLLLALQAIPLEAFLALVAPGPVTTVGAAAYSASRARVKAAEQAASRGELFDAAVGGSD